MLVAVVAVFAVTWTPFHAHSVIAEFRHDLLLGRFFKLGDVLCRVLAFSSACVNPVLYGWMNDHYRAAFFALVTRRSAAAAVGRPASRPRSLGVATDDGGGGGGEKLRGRLAVPNGGGGDSNLIEIQLSPLTKSSLSQANFERSTLWHTTLLPDSRSFHRAVSCAPPIFAASLIRRQLSGLQTVCLLSLHLCDLSRCCLWFYGYFCRREAAVVLRKIAKDSRFDCSQYGSFAFFAVCLRFPAVLCGCIKPHRTSAWTA